MKCILTSQSLQVKVQDSFESSSRYCCDATTAAQSCALCPPSCSPQLEHTWPPHCSHAMGGSALTGSSATKAEAPWPHHQLTWTAHFPQPLLRCNTFINHIQHNCWNKLWRFVHINYTRKYTYLIHFWGLGNGQVALCNRKQAHLGVKRSDSYIRA